MKIKQLVDELNAMREHLPDDYEVLVVFGMGLHHFDLQADGDSPCVQIQPSRYPTVFPFSEG